MSAEHGGHGSHTEETTVTSVLVSLLLGLLMIPQLLEKFEEVTQSLTNPQAGGHGGH